jgi:hypothetical protein
MAKQIHTTYDGHSLEWDPPPEVTLFFEQLIALVADPARTESDLIEFAYSKDNPILDPTMFATRGAVTKAVLADPADRVMTDLLFRKALASDGSDVGAIAARYAMTIR